MSIIYEPSGRAREYAALACNVYRGCDHGCVYCFAPRVTKRTSRAEFHQPEERKDFLRKLEKEAEVLPPAERILLCFTTDAYQQLDVEAQITRRTIEILHRYGHSVQILTKGGSRALRDLDLFTPADAFATTLTFAHNEILSAQWEPRAAPPLDRIATIRSFHAAGIETWVSLEPVINPSNALGIIRSTYEIVDLYKVGKLNYHPLANKIDWRNFGAEVVTLLELLKKKYYIKEDLQKYLDRSQQTNQC